MMYRLFALILFISGCANFSFSPEFAYQEIEANGFKIATWHKIKAPQSTYYVYIEGDGHAFNVSGQPTNNPTPKSSLVRRLAVNDMHENVIYLARPCQFIKNHQCNQKYWTVARFAPEIVEAEYQSIKNIVKNKPVVLIGYSGGAQIAGLIAVTKDLNVQGVVTIAGNLDHKAWTDFHHLPPLSKSLNLADYKDKFALIPQIHYAGEKDNVIPPILTKAFVADETLIRLVPKATHGDGWDEKKIFFQDDKIGYSR